MDLLADDLVLPLHMAGRDFLEVLLTQFSLAPVGQGIRLTVSLDDDAPTIWLDEAKSRLLSLIPDFPQKAAEYQRRLDAILVSGDRRRWDYDDRDFPFRFVGGGTLPIVCMGGTEYYALVYREIFPVGWNIANGGADSVSELLDPFQAVERELREELVVFDARLGSLFVFETETSKPEARPEYLAARRLWKDRKSAFGVRRLEDLGEVLLPVKWLDGPDSLQVGLGSEPAVTLEACFLNINAVDFGIEVDRIAKLNLGDAAVFADGEFIGSQMVGSVVGLFEVERMDAAVLSGATALRPDVFYHDLVRHQRDGDLEGVLESHISRMQRVRSPRWDRTEWDNVQAKLALCPATSRILRRCARLHGDSHAGSEPEYDVFLSYATEDEQLATAVYDYLTRDGRRRVFFSRQLAHSAYGEEIDKALTSATSFVAVASSPRHMRKKWLSYECRAFHNYLLNGGKPEHSEMLSYIADFEPRELPLPLLCYQAITHDAADPGRSLAELARFVGA